MVTTFTDRLRFAKQGTGDNSNTWGAELNDAVFELVDDALGGVVAINVTTGANITLTTANGATDQARKMTLKLTGTPINNIDIIVPDEEKMYLIDGTAFLGAFTISLKGSSGNSVDFVTGDKGVIYNDGTDVLEIFKTPTAAVAGTPAFRVGDYKSSAKSTDHDSWLLMDGRTLDSISNTQFANLFTEISTTFGGTGAADFQIPDYRGRVGVGLDNMGTSEGAANRITNAQADSLGGNAGLEFITPSGSITIPSATGATTLTTSQLPSQTYEFLSSWTGGGAGGDFFQTSSTDIPSTTPNYSTSISGGTAIRDQNGGGSHTHTIGSGSFSGNQHDKTQPWIAEYKFIAFADV